MIWIALAAALFIQVVVFTDSYYDTEAALIPQVRKDVEKSMRALMVESLDGSRGMVASGDDDSTFWIVRDDVRYRFTYDTSMYRIDNFDRASYDISNREVWNLKNLSGIFQQKMTWSCLPFIFIREDSAGNRIDSCRYRVTQNDTVLQHRFTIPLGFLDKHRLKVYFAFPWKDFWAAEKSKFLLVFLLSSLGGVCAVSFFKLVDKQRRKSENQKLFLQALNHDLRLPVAELQTRIYQIKCCSPLDYTARQEELYDRACKKSEAILKMIDRFLIDSMDMEGLHLNRKWFDLQALFENLTGQLEAGKPEDKNMKIIFDFQMQNPGIWADEYHLARALMNLLWNAVKYSGTDLVIHISCREEGKFVVIVIQDNGVGIDRSELKNIFHRNYRGNRKVQQQNIKGFGIGLSYVKMIVRAHQGKIEVESKPHEGSTFTLYLKRRGNGR